MIHPRSCNAKLNFYPRSPCGERLVNGGGLLSFFDISIHALLAESDAAGRFCYLDNIISIHALLAESDTGNIGWAVMVPHFYPRSPCGERPIDK